MAVIAGLLVLLGFLLILVTLLGVVAPAFFKDKKTGEIPQRKHMAAGGAAATLAAFILAGVVGPKDDASKSAETNQPVAQSAVSQVDREQVKPATVVKTLGMKPEEFRQEFNRRVSQVDKDYKLAELDVEEGAVNNTFQRSMAPNVGLMGSVNKVDGSIKELMVMVGGGKTEDVLKPVVVLLTVSQTANPKVATAENSKVVMDMLKKAMAQVETGESVERDVGELRYTASASKITGLMFAISPR